LLDFGKQGGSNVTVTYRHVPAQQTEGLTDLVESSIRQSDSSSLVIKQSIGHADREIFEEQGAQLEHGGNLDHDPIRLKRDHGLALV
jgi:hypothetical protein